MYEGGGEAVNLVEGASAKSLSLGLVGRLAGRWNDETLKASLAPPPVGPTDDRIVKETPPFGEHAFAELPCLGVQDIVAVDMERRQGFVGR